MTKGQSGEGQLRTAEANVPAELPRYIRVDMADNVAIIVNDFGLPRGTRFACGLQLREHVPQGHKVALVDIAKGAPVRRYNVVIGYANEPLQAGSWVHEALLSIPEAPPLHRMPVATRAEWNEPTLAGYTFEGYRNTDGSVGTRNVLAITTTVQCVAGVVDHAVQRIRSELLPRFPNVDDAIGLEHIYGCGVAIDAPDADIPIRTLRNISLNPNFGGGLMVVGLGCESSPSACSHPELWPRPWQTAGISASIWCVCRTSRMSALRR